MNQCCTLLAVSGLALSTILTTSPGLAQGLEIAGSSLSADGDSIVFIVSSGGGSSNGSEVRLFRLSSGETVQIHLDSQGNPPGNFDVSGAPSVSADGDVVALASFADLDLSNPDNNGTADVFARLVGAADTQLASINNAGVQSNAGGQFPVVSEDGRYVAFQTVADNVDPSDNDGGNHDIFVRDLVAGQTVLVSLDDAGGQIAQPATDPRVSADGQFVAFEVFVGGGLGNVLRLADVQAGTSAVVSLDETDQPITGSQTFIGDLSANGRWLTFQTNGAAIATDTNGLRDVYVRDLMAGTTQRISLAMGGQQTDAASGESRISADGNIIAFESQASNLVSGDSNGVSDVFVVDRLTGNTERVSVASNGSEADEATVLQGLSADGRFVLLRSASQVLAPGAEECSGALACNLYLHDRQAATMRRIPTPDATAAFIAPPPALTMGAGFGSTTAVNGSDLIIGSPSAGSSGMGQGAVEVYRLIEGQPVSVATLLAPAEFEATGFGASVAISGDVLVVGTRAAPLMRKSLGRSINKGSATQPLEVAVFERSNGAWTFLQALTGQTPNSEFGYAVAIDGQTLLVGAPSDLTSGSLISGAAYLFSRSASGAEFVLADTVAVEGAAIDARFGAAVALKNGLAAVGAPQDSLASGNPAASGSFSTYDISSGILALLNRQGLPSAAAGDRLGAAVSVSAGGVVVIGAPGENGEGGDDEGAVYLGSATGNTLQRIVPGDPVPGGRFGAAVDISGNTFVVGAPGAQVDNDPIGAIYRFRLAGQSAGLVRRRSAPENQMDFGSSVAISGQRIVIGAPGAGAGGAQLITDPNQIFSDGSED